MPRIAVAFAVLLAAGCLDATDDPAVITVEHHVTWTGDPNGRLLEGDHCIFATWSGDRLVLDRQRPLGAALIAHTYRPDEFEGSRLSPRYNGGDELGTFVRDVVVGLDQPLNRSFTEGSLARLRLGNGQLFVNDVLVPPEGLEVSDSYRIEGGSVHERALVRLRPDVEVVLDPRPVFCD